MSLEENYYRKRRGLLSSLIVTGSLFLGAIGYLHMPKKIEIPYYASLSFETDPMLNRETEAYIAGGAGGLLGLMLILGSCWPSCPESIRKKKVKKGGTLYDTLQQMRK